MSDMHACISDAHRCLLECCLLLRFGGDQAVLQLEMCVHAVPHERKAAEAQVVLDFALGRLAVFISQVLGIDCGVDGTGVAPAPRADLDVGLLECLAEDLVQGGNQGVRTLDGSGGDVAQTDVDSFGEANPLLREGGLDASRGGDGRMGGTAVAAGLRVGNEGSHQSGISGSGGREVGIGEELRVERLWLGL